MSNKLAFGNPTNDLVAYLKQPNYLDSLLEELKNTPPPEDNSKETIDELQKIVTYINELMMNESAKVRFDVYDYDFENYIIESLVKQGIDKNEVYTLVKSIHDDIIPLLVKVKFHHQRVRPHQLAYYFNLDLYPFKSYTANTPSYPSGHAYQSKIYAEVLGNRYPKYFKPLNELAKDIAASRLYLGLHYPSDAEFAFYMADLVVNHPDFKKKYKL
jgi:hypothetical protein